MNPTPQPTVVADTSPDVHATGSRGFALPKRCRLSGTKRIERLFAQGSGGYCHPFRYITLEGEVDAHNTQGAAIMISVPKRNLKRAVWRNTVRRRTREAYRLNHHSVGEAGEGRFRHTALIYTSKQVLDYKTIEAGVKRILDKIERGH